MPIWTIVDYPKSGENNSPLDYVDKINELDEKDDILERLSFMRDHEFAQWPKSWTFHVWEKVYEIKTKNYRVMYFLENKNIVILHACRKVKQKAKKIDLDRVKNHYHRYLDEKD
jgi:phage-related protein